MDFMSSISVLHAVWVAVPPTVVYLLLSPVISGYGRELTFLKEYSMCLSIDILHLPYPIFQECHKVVYFILGPFLLLMFVNDHPPP